jgi:DNA recombination protein RmuC
MADSRKVREQAREADARASETSGQVSAKVRNDLAAQARQQARVSRTLAQQARQAEAARKTYNRAVAKATKDVDAARQLARVNLDELREHFGRIDQTSGQLRAEASELVAALRAPQVQGRWGEMQLRRVVEAAGMIEHCDFDEQGSTRTDDGLLRPDLVVWMASGKNVVVDAKVPLQAYLEATEAQDEETRTARLGDHARQIRQHVAKLSLKSYWEQFQPAPEFVVMFIPGEAFYSAALEQDPGLIEEGVSQRVLLATPTTLIGVLKAVAYGWHQETVAESARAVSALGKELHGRLAVLGDHMARLGLQLDRAVTSYNQTVGSLERRVLPAARRFSELGADGGREIPALEPIDKSTQVPQALELTGGAPQEPPEPGLTTPERDAA